MAIRRTDGFATIASTVGGKAIHVRPQVTMVSARIVAKCAVGILSSTVFGKHLAQSLQRWMQNQRLRLDRSDIAEVEQAKRSSVNEE